VDESQKQLKVVRLELMALKSQTKSSQNEQNESKRMIE